MSNLNIKNRTIFCRDNLDILEGINSNCIDLIYLDPPFNKKKQFTAPMGSSAEGASFRDWFKEEDVKDEWLQTIKEDYDGIYQFLTSVRNLSSFQSHKNKHYLYNYCYLCYMAVRLIEMHRILKDTGSIYLHCDPTMSHYLKILMDLIFGENNFRNEIVWCYEKFSNRANYFLRNHDIIIFYCKNKEKIFFHKLEKEHFTLKKSAETILRQGYHILNNHKKLLVYNSLKANKKIKEAKEKGFEISYLERKKKYENDYWLIENIPSQSNERVGYPTQKPIKLLERIINASSNEGDIVLDPFCGCATTCVASEKLDRQWIGVDISIKAYELVKQRLKNEVANPENIFDYEKDLNFSASPPKRTDTNGEDNIVKKYVYVVSHPQYKGLYKVGIAKDWKSRLNSYQTSDPLRQYKMEYKHLTPLFRETEKHIHNIFDNLGEWVQASLENIKKEIENYKKK